MPANPDETRRKRAPEPTWANIARVLLDILRISIAVSLVHMSRRTFAIGLPRLSLRTLRLADAVTPAHLKDARWPLTDA
jgi:hypothetical protein